MKTAIFIVVLKLNTCVVNEYMLSWKSFITGLILKVVQV